MRSNLRLALLGWAICAGTVGVRAQAPDLSSILGQGSVRSRGEQAMNLGVSLGESYDTADPLFGGNAVGSHAQASLSYRRRRGPTLFGFNVESGLRYYGESAQRPLADRAVGFEFATRLGRRTLLEATERVGYSPVSLLSALAGPTSTSREEAPGSSTDYAIFGRNTVRDDTAANLTYIFSRRSSVMMSYALQYRSTQPGYELNDHKAAVTFRRQISQYGAVHAGYGYRSAAYRGSLLENIRSDDLDIGLDYSRALPFSRRTTFAVGTGSFILSDGHARRFRGTGYALLNHQISRAWNARLEYRRPLQFIEGIATPLVADSIVGSIGGPVARRMNLTVSTWSSRGAAGLATANKFETLSTSAQVRFAVMRHWAITAEYLYFHYLFSGSLPLLPGIASASDRQSVRIGLTGSLPLLRD